MAISSCDNLGTCNVSDGPDFLSTALRLMKEALALGAAFQPDATSLLYASSTEVLMFMHQPVQ